MMLEEDFRVQVCSGSSTNEAQLSVMDSFVQELNTNKQAIKQLKE